MRAAGALYAELEGDAQDALLARIAYQAGFPDEVLAHANRAKKEARANERLDDVVELNQLAIQTLDPELATLSLPDPTAELGFRIDSAVRFATPLRPAGLSESEVDHQVLALLIENLDCLASIGSGSSGLSESTLTEAAMLAQRRRDPMAMARLSNLEGRLSFERDDVERSLQLHRRAEEMFERAGGGRLRARVENLIRLAICYRTLGEHERSLDELRRAMHMVPRGEWSLFNTIRNNVGAVFLKRDWSIARRQWEKELAHARRHGLERRTAHALLGLSFLDLFEGDLEGGAAKSRLGLTITDRLHLDNQHVRAALNLSVYCVLMRNYDEALAWLQDGERIALQHQIGRRLWRVVANLATVHELRGEPELSAIRDRQVLNLMQGDASAPPPMYGRQVLALVNVILRRDAGIGSATPLPALPPESFEYARIAASRSGRLPDLMSNYCVELPVGPRFLLTE
jgi:tetratricopeptide (TPR) repeat protein